jgi:hypothetical protein
LIELHGFYTLWFHDATNDRSITSENFQASSDVRMTVFTFPFVAVTSKQGTSILKLTEKSITQVGVPLGTKYSSIGKQITKISDKSVVFAAVNEVIFCFIL